MLAITFGSVTGHAQDELVLTQDGAPAASIVIAKQANRAVRFAAAELQHHIKLITGAELPILPKARNLVEDLSGHGNAGLIFGLGAGTVREPDDRFGTVLRFNGAEGQNWVVNDGTLDLPSAFTVAIWLKPERTPDDANGILHTPSYLLRMSLHKDDNKAYVRLKRADGTYQNYRLTRETVPEDTWTCLAFSYDGAADVLRGYRDGEMVVEHTDIGGLRREDWHGRLVVGHGLNTGGTFKGRLGEVRVYDRVVPAHTGPARPGHGLVAQWRFDPPDPAVADGTRILVGESEATRKLGLRSEDFDHQEYLIKFLPDTLVLMGRDKEDSRAMSYADPGTFPGMWDDQASCYAVYDFLERFCGVRWYLPTDVGMVCPRQRTLAVTGKDVRRAPAMKYRQLNRAANVPASLTDIAGPVLGGREGRLFEGRQRLFGIEPYACNHAFYGYYKRHLRDRPEWFAKGYDDEMPEGMREQPIKEYSHDSFPMKYYPNMCYTNPEFIQHVVERARNFFDTGHLEGGERAAGDFFSLGPMDSSGQDRFCKCPTCQELLHDKPPCDAWRKQWFFFDDRYSDYVFSFVNRVAREVAKTHPDKYVSIFAYHQNYYPPTREPVEPNVAVTFCMHEQLRAVPAMDRAVTALMDKWDDAAPRNPKYLWLYFHRPGRADPFFPGFMAHQLVRHMKDYHRRGFRGIFAEPAYMPGGRAPIVNMLEIYLAYKLADDPTLDGETLIDEFFTGYYGHAGPAMQALYEKIEQVYCDPANYAFNTTTYVGYQTDEIAWGRLGTPERMAEFGKLMAAAREAARTDMEKTRVGLFEKSVWERMQTAARQYRDKAAARRAGLKSACAPRVPGAAPNGDLASVDWSQAGLLDGWASVVDGKPTPRRIEGRIMHDGRYVYLRLREMTDPASLLRTEDVWSGDDWEVFVAPERGKTYRQIGINVEGQYKGFAYGEPERNWESSAKVVSDTSTPNHWEVQLALPLESLAPGGIKPGRTLYLNIARGTKGDVDRSLMWIPTLARSFHSATQLGAVSLAEKAGTSMEKRLEGE